MECVYLWYTLGTLYLLKSRRSSFLAMTFPCFQPTSSCTESTGSYACRIVPVLPLQLSSWMRHTHARLAHTRLRCSTSLGGIMCVRACTIFVRDCVRGSAGHGWNMMNRQPYWPDTRTTFAFLLEDGLAAECPAAHFGYWLACSA